MTKKIAITGGIGSGKSVVLQCAKNLGYPVFSCDEIYRDIIKTPAYVEKISSIFPDCVIGGAIDKKRLAEIVFNNDGALQKLNEVAHPMIMNVLFSEMDKVKEKIAFAEVPLLFEGGYENKFHETIYVKRNIDARIKAIVRRDQTDECSAKKRIATQFDPDSKMGQEKLKNIGASILENNADISYLEKWLQNFISRILCETN